MVLPVAGTFNGQVDSFVLLNVCNRIRVDERLVDSGWVQRSSEEAQIGPQPTPYNQIVSTVSIQPHQPIHLATRANLNPV